MPKTEISVKSPLGAPVDYRLVLLVAVPGNIDSDTENRVRSQVSGWVGPIAAQLRQEIMSSQVHSDAEETIRFFVARVGADEGIRERMAVETVWFSGVMLYFAVQRFLAATSSYGRYYGMSQAVTALNRGERILEEELQRVAAVVANA